MNLFFLLLDVILPNSIILFAIWKVENVTVKWYGINLLAASSLASVGYYASVELEIKLKSSNEVLVLMKSRVFILAYLFAQAVSIPIASLKLIKNEAVVAFVTMCHYCATVVIYLNSIIIMFAAIYTAYRNKLFSENHQLKEALKPLIFYFLPITLIDLCIVFSATGLTINTDWLDVLFQIITINMKFRATVVVLCTVFVLPPFRKALFNLLGIESQRRIAVVQPFTEIHSNAGRSNI
ncbi:unnamed protein product [Cercopithifilaria johnstoni]|uniref:Uncharacterized protein n=1 Tax=Cercopithifilaria johnstoni TaxID=2874296 RepID=A0A8J2Q3V2_9BILA|nr:unnamed protein product [Cercopithifilaria johnstoni]